MVIQNEAKPSAVSASRPTPERNNSRIAQADGAFTGL